MTYRGKERNHKQEILDYLAKVKEHNINDIIALDETGIYAGLHTSYGRYNLGKDAVIRLPTTKYSRSIHF